jgi:hypothetical protein
MIYCLKQKAPISGLGLLKKKKNEKIFRIDIDVVHYPHWITSCSNHAPNRNVEKQD